MRWKLSVLMLCALFFWGTPALAQGSGAGDDAELNAVDALAVDEQDDGTYIRIEGTEEATFSVFKLDHPPRLFVDLSNSKLAGDELSRDVYNGVISTVNLIEFEDGFQEVARLVVGFEEPAHYDVRTEGNEVVVFIDGDARDDGGAVAADDELLQQREAELAEAQARLEGMEQRYESEVEQRASDYESARSELENTRQELSQAQRELTQMREQRDQASGEELRQLESAIDEQTQALQSAQAQAEDKERDVERMQQSMAELKEERDAERARFEEAQRQAEQARQGERRAHAQIDELQGRLGEMDTEVDNAEARIAEQRRQLESAQSRAERLERELAEARQQEEGSADASQRLQQERQALEEARQDAERAEAAVAQAEAERAEWQQAREDYQAELQQLERQASEAEAEKERLSRAIAERDGEIERLQREVGQAATEEERQRLSEAIDARDSEIARLKEEISAVESDDAERQRLSEALAERDEEIERLRARSAQPPAHDQAPEARAVPVDPSDENSIQAVRLETDDRGRSQIVVDLERPGHFKAGEAGNNGRSVMVLNDVELPPEMERTLSADGDGGVVRFVSSFTEDDGSVRLEADLRGESSEVIRQDGSSVVWEFAPEIADKGEQDGALAGDRQPERPTEGDSVTSAPPGQARVVADPTSVRRVPGMGTRPITIDLRNADIENVLRLISSESGVNIIAGDDVSGNVTMKLQGVPMDEAFLTILQSLQLGYEIRGNVLRVASQDVLNEEEAARAEARARAQEVEPLEVFLLPVNYASAGDLTTQVDGLLSPRGSVSVDDRTNTLIIKDLSDNLQSIRMLIETLDAQVPQVLIEARIVETNEAFDREFGIQWGGDFSMSQGGGNPTGLVFPNVFGVSGGATDGEAPVEGTSENPNYAVNLPATAGTGAGGAMGLTMGSVGGTVNLNMRLSAMEAAGYAKIISSPRILTLDNRQATISQGTSIPISVVSAAGVQTIFVDATLELTVTPHVTPDGNVQMSIEATKNEPDFQNTGAQGDPTIIQNQAQTELLVADGDTTVIGGIYTENTGQSISAVPFLHRIPILGFLFRSHSRTENRSELLIFITPRIVNRAEALGVMSTGTMGQ